MQTQPLLRGWANYYRNGAAKRTFSQLDFYIHYRLRRWATRCHPKKSQAWKQRKYFSAADQPWVFSARVHTTKGESRLLQLYRMASRIKSSNATRMDYSKPDPLCASSYKNFHLASTGCTRLHPFAPDCGST